MNLPIAQLRKAGLGAALACALVGLALCPAPARAELFNPEVYFLDNGLEIVVLPNPRAPIVHHMIWYKVGAADERPGESGLAHFLEHLLFKGTTNAAPGEFSDAVAANGGRENAFTSWDYTGFYQTVASDRLEMVMRYEADRMTNLVLQDDAVMSERDVVLEERRSRTDNDPGSRLGEMAQAVLYLNHPYRIPVIGWQHEIEALSRDAALNFYHRWYAPNNAVLIVAGDVTGPDVLALAERYYGVVPAADVPDRARPIEPVQGAARRVELVAPEAGQEWVSIEYIAPSYRTAEGNEAYALQLLDEILSGGATSRLYHSLVVEGAIAASAGSSYSPTAYDLSSFSLFAVPRGDFTLEETEAALRGEVARLLEEGISEDELARAKFRTLSAIDFARDNLSTAPQVFGSALTTGQTVEDVEAWPERIEAVSVDDIMAAARSVFVDTSSVTSLLRLAPAS